MSSNEKKLAVPWLMPLLVASFIATVHMQHAVTTVTKLLHEGKQPKASKHAIFHRWRCYIGPPLLKPVGMCIARLFAKIIQN